MTLRLSLRAAHRSLTEPAENAHTRWSERSSTIITLEGDEGMRASGEAAPLPKYSPDTIGACEAALAALDLRALPERLEPGEDVVSALSRASRAIPRTLPAARAALEAALLALWAKSARVPAWALLGTHAPKPRQLAALISREPEHWLEQIRAAQNRGLRACKLKVGRAGAAKRELHALAEARAAFGPDFTLRLDANRAWTGAEAEAILPELARSNIELIEEPCALAELVRLDSARPPIALDESLSERSPDATTASLFERAGARALVLKPTLLGGVSGCFAWASLARELGLDVILSHAFEGPLGLALSATLALTLGSPTRAHGLDLQGARLSPAVLSYFAHGELRAWNEPGFGTLEEP